MNNILVYLRDVSIEFLKGEFGLSQTLANLTQSIIALILVIFLSWFVGRIGKSLMSHYIPRITKKTKNTWDDLLVDNKVFVTLSYYIFGLMFICVDEFIAAEGLRKIIQNLTGTYFTIVTIILIDNVLNTLYAIYMSRKGQDKANIKIYIQVIKVLLYSIGVIIVISYFADKNFMDILKGLGAMLTILLIVYKDSILGFVAGINLSAYKMMEVGDWIVAPKHGADGTVLEIGLSAVKVQNWDNTITTIPPYALVSESFTNWKGMQDSGGRRIKRSINIDLDTVRFLTPEEIEHFQKFDLLKDYITEKKQLIAKDNKGKEDIFNQRRLTNVGTFKRYVENYLHTTGYVHPDMTSMVRQLQSTEKGLPIEVYFFSTEQRWVEYEQIQADIFDHIFAIAPEFGLRVYQNASSRSVGEIAQKH